MSSLLQELNLRWTADLSVGSAALDGRNQRMFSRLAQADAILAAPAADGDPAVRRRALTDWLDRTLAQLTELLDEEERELAAAGYPELAFHRQLHAAVRLRMTACRTRLAPADGMPQPEQLDAIVRQTCAELAVWLMRHMQDADKLFAPYVDRRFRRTGP